MLYNCQSKTENTSINQLNGEYCAKIDYFSNNTGVSNTVNLNIDIKDGYLTNIQWPKSAWLENLYLPETKITGDIIQFTDDKGRNFTVKILHKGKCID